MERSHLRFSFLAAGFAAAIVALFSAVAEGAVSAEELRTYLKRHPAPDDYEWASKSVAADVIAASRSGHPGTAAAQLASQWHDSTTVAAAAIELVVLPEISNGSDATHALRRRMESAVDVVTRSPGASRGAWRTVLGALDEELGCDRANARSRYFANEFAVDDMLHNDSVSCYEWIWEAPRHVAPTALLYGRLLDETRSEAEQLVAANMLRASLADMSPPSDPALALFARRKVWLLSLENGLVADVLDEAASLSRDELVETLDDGAVSGAIVEGVELESAAQVRNDVNSLQHAWVVALLSRGERALATEWIARWKWKQPPDPLTTLTAERKTTESDETGGVTWHLVHDAPDADVFGVFVLYNQLAGFPLDSTTGRGVAIDYVNQHGYPEFAAALRARACWSDPTDESADWSAFPDAVRTLRLGLMARIDAARRAASDCAQEPAQVPADAHHVAELDLAQNLRTTRRKSDSEGAEDLKGVPKELSGYHVVRYCTDGDASAAISLSQAADPVGEVSGGGYWLHLSHDHGKTWEPPVPLALQQYQPYVVMGASRLPLIRGDKLQIEVAVREVDPSTIMFPPVALTPSRVANDKYIELDIGELTRDSDGDRLTDVLEGLLLTDPHDPDTDHDGVRDDVDPLPQVPVNEAPVADVDVIREAMRRVFGYDEQAIGVAPPGASPGASLDLQTQFEAAAKRPYAPNEQQTMFVVGDPSLFRGLNLPRRVVVLTDEQVRHVERQRPIFYPVAFRLWFNHDHSMAYLDWSAGWVGGTVLFRKQDGAWRSDVASQWITRTPHRNPNLKNQLVADDTFRSVTAGAYSAADS